MNKYPDKHRRKSLRLKDYDYTSPGFYFITAFIKNREIHFGEIKDHTVVLNKMGRIANAILKEIPKNHPNAALNAYVIMPNHVHCIIQLLDKTKSKGVACNTPFTSEYHSSISPSSGSLSVIIRNYKSSVTRQCRLKGHNYFQWHRGFHDTIIRSDKQLHAIREYIKTNPQNWEQDPENNKSRP